MKRKKPSFPQITSIILFLFLFSCGKELETSIPIVSTSFQVSLTIYNELKNPSGVHYFADKGYGGIIVINTGFGYSAYDATCPYEVDTQYLVEEEGGIGTCSGCGSTYNLLDGGLLMSGPSTENLLLYRVTATENYLYITNY